LNIRRVHLISVRFWVVYESYLKIDLFNS
jgi:hypothetical protein